ncbi:MAG: PAS domain S-box protein, partial [Candidatus Krumholzibacteria bacterium]|nr:PAS domain S-box protein [Candidatus Krumholzibacteria bacterium]
MKQKESSKQLERESAETGRTNKKPIESPEGLKTILNATDAAIFVLDIESGTILYANNKTCEITGYTTEELSHLTWGDISSGKPPFDKEHALQLIKKTAAGKPQLVEWCVKDGAGRLFRIEINLRLARIGGENRVLATVLDITDRKRTEEKLRSSEERLTLALEATNDGLWDLDLGTGDMYFNPNDYTMLGYEPYEIQPSLEMWESLLHPDDRETAEKTFGEVIEGKKEDFEIKFRLKTKSGEWRWVSSRGKAIEWDSEGKTIRMVGTLADIDERKRAEEALHREQEKFRTLIEQSPLGISIISEDSRYKYINPKFTEIFGYTLDDISTDNTWLKEKARHRTFSVTSKDGTQKIIKSSSTMMKTGGFFVSYEDITEQRRLERQLLQAQKMEAIGTMAGGIAHDFNNLLMDIEGHVSMMLLDSDSSHPFHEDLASIEEMVKSAEALTSQLLAFARGGEYEPKPIDLNELIEGSSRIFSRTKKEIQIHKKLQKDIWTVEADEGQIEQVLLNLYVNAWQAMPGGGSIYINSENVTLDENYTEPFGTKPGNYVKISVVDTGVGMDESTRQRIFEPFFTTRNAGRGTGLGLAAAYGIIKNHEGIINVYSEKGKGTIINIFLPASEKQLME